MMLERVRRELRVTVVCSQPLRLQRGDWFFPVRSNTKRLNHRRCHGIAPGVAVPDIHFFGLARHERCRLE